KSCWRTSRALPRRSGSAKHLPGRPIGGKRSLRRLDCGCTITLHKYQWVPLTRCSVHQSELDRAWMETPRWRWWLINGWLGIIVAIIVATVVAVVVGFVWVVWLGITATQG